MAGQFLKFPKKNKGTGAKKKNNNKNGQRNWKERQQHLRRKRKRNDWNNGNDEKERPKKKMKTKSYKGRIRDIGRLLKRPNLKIEIREAKEKELLELKKGFAQHKVETQNNRRHMRHNNKFGAPKFYDKRKLLRKLEKVNSALGRTEKEEESAKLETDRENLLDDLNYIEKFPKHLKYVSIIMARKKNDARQLKQIQEIKDFLKQEQEKKEKAKAEKEEKMDEESDSEELDEEFIRSVKQSAMQKTLNEQKEEKELEKELKKIQENEGISKQELTEKNKTSIRNSEKKTSTGEIKEKHQEENVFEDELFMLAGEDAEEKDKEIAAEKKNDASNLDAVEGAELTRAQKKKMGILKAREKKKKKSEN